MIITSALSIQDPRERPMDKQQASDEKHRRFHDKESDFLAFVKSVELSWRAAKGAFFQRLPSPVSYRLPQLSARARMAGYLHPVASGGERTWHSG
ncbi:hypothetical protein [Escherichia coli]|uniref:hypothetical protein n=1 Tax=Escherichia coli TaxID=562 RepID=UPI0032E8F419